MKHRHLILMIILGSLVAATAGLLGCSLSSKEDTIALTNALPAWKQIYIDYINEYEREHDVVKPEYSLVYINDDDIPELFIQGVDRAEGSTLCVFDGDRLNAVYLEADPGFSYIERASIFHDQGGHMDRYYDIVYRIQNNQIVTMHAGRFGWEDDTVIQVDEDGNVVKVDEYDYFLYYYFWNGTQVSESEYAENLRLAFDTAQAKHPYGKLYSASEIIEQIKKL
ncbi:MAG: hypothetical protein FWE69_08745 [Clostridiales bacterium]|nr:hypothetical protein [Clostridiales bacterium]